MHTDNFKKELHILREENARLKAILSDLFPCGDLTEINNEHCLLINKMKSLGFLIGDVAHEINNPNNLIKVNSTLLEEIWKDLKPLFHEKIENTPGFKLGNISGDKLEKSIDSLILGVKDGSERIMKVTDGLRAYIDRASNEAVKVFDLHTAIENVTMLLRARFMKTTNDFKVERKCNSLYVEGVQQNLEQVIMNVLLNACEALTSREQSIKLETSIDETGELAIIKVSDTGTGIEPKDLEQITAPFFTTKHETGGTGLGLSTALFILKAHKGNLNFISIPGKGTTVEIVLPLAHKDKIFNLQITGKRHG